MITVKLEVDIGLTRLYASTRIDRVKLNVELVMSVASLKWTEESLATHKGDGVAVLFKTMM